MEPIIIEKKLKISLINPLIENEYIEKVLDMDKERHKIKNKYLMDNKKFYEYYYNVLIDRNFDYYDYFSKYGDYFLISHDYKKYFKIEKVYSTIYSNTFPGIIFTNDLNERLNLAHKYQIMRLKVLYKNLKYGGNFIISFFHYDNFTQNMIILLTNLFEKIVIIREYIICINYNKKIKYLKMVKNMNKYSFGNYRVFDKLRENDIKYTRFKKEVIKNGYSDNFIKNNLDYYILFLSYDKYNTKTRKIIQDNYDKIKLGKKIIKHIFKKYNPMNILEINMNYGLNTYNISKYMDENKNLISLNPDNIKNNIKIKNHTIINEVSIKVLIKLEKKFDLIIIDKETSLDNLIFDMVMINELLNEFGNLVIYSPLYPSNYELIKRIDNNYINYDKIHEDYDYVYYKKINDAML